MKLAFRVPPDLGADAVTHPLNLERMECVVRQDVGSLKGQLAAAERLGRPETATHLRLELACALAENRVEKALRGLGPISLGQAARLHEVVENLTTAQVDELV